MSAFSKAKGTVVGLLRTLLGLDGRRPTQRIFEQIYAEGRWGKQGDDGFSSGGGSHFAAIVEPYVAAVARFLESMGTRPNVVDLGCGDFNVGRRLRPFCAQYIGCDIVEPLVLRNRRRFAELDVDFRVLDLVTETWPSGDVVFIRQVLQHLNNRQIQKVVPKLATFSHAIVTEHLPAITGFTPDSDKVTGEFIRMQQKPRSGVVLHAPPFGLNAIEQRTLCAVPADGGVIVTTLYRFR